MKGGEVKVEKNGKTSKWKKMFSAATANDILLDIMTRTLIGIKETFLKQKRKVTV